MILNITLLITGLICISYWIMQRWRMSATKLSPAGGTLTAENPPSWIQTAEVIFPLLLFIKCAQWFGIEWVLVSLTAVSGLLALVYFIASRKLTTLRSSKIYEQARGFFPILFIVLLLRSFWIEPYQIPSGSLIPTLLVGDLIVVNKYHYGFRLPITHQIIKPNHSPQPGEIMVFLWPVDPSMYFIKRVIGVPGDRIAYRNKTIYRNGKAISQTTVGLTAMQDETGTRYTALAKQENLNGRKHMIYLRPDVASHDMQELVVPPGHYFMMGDNRDGSFDSRGWGLVPDRNIVGQASRIWFSFDTLAETWRNKIRWDRIGKKIQ